jgi:hypothetical protein
MGQQAGQRLEGLLTKPLALGDQPFLEGRLGDREPFQEIAAIQRDGLTQLGDAAHFHEPLESRDVDVQRFGLQPHGLVVDAEPRPGPPQALAQREQGLAQAPAGRRVTRVGPQQRSQLVARMRLPRRGGEIGEQGLRLLPGQVDWRVARGRELEATQQTQSHGRPSKPPRMGENGITVAENLRWPLTLCNDLVTRPHHPADRAATRDVRAPGGRR